MKNRTTLLSTGLALASLGSLLDAQSQPQGPVPPGPRSQAALSSGPCLGGFLEYGHGCDGSGGIAPELRVSGCVVSGGTLDIELTDGLGGAPAFLAVGLAQAQIPVLDCTLLVAPLLLIQHMPPLSGPFGLPGAGRSTLSVALSASSPAPSFTVQGFTIDFGAPNGLVATSNGVEVRPDALEIEKGFDLNRSSGALHLALPAGFLDRKSVV